MSQPDLPLTSGFYDPGPAVIALVGVSKWYGDVIGVNQVNLSIRSGVTGLLGPNGAGKSTLMKLMTGQLKPGRGAVEVLGESPWRNPQVFRELGYCPDSDSFYEDMTGYEFVTLMGRLANFSGPDARKRASAQLERTGMADAMHRRIRGYSKGMRQRTKLAAALLQDPQIVVLDEPLNGLDPMGRIQMLDLFRALGKEGRTVVVSSHILHEIENLTRTIVLINHGRILAEGEIEEVRSLIENQPLTLRIESAKPREVGRSLARLESVTSLQFGGVAESAGADSLIAGANALVVRTTHPESVYEALQEGVLENRYTVDELTALDDNLEAVFQYLVKE